MIPIKLALLWHQHQPDYRNGPRMVLPWVRMHAMKDYLEMVQHLERHPKMRATINLVPSLIKQLEAYGEGMEDDLLHLSKKPADVLTEKERDYLLDECFHSNREQMIARQPRYLELLEKKERHERFSDQDIRDLIICNALAWTGEFLREEEPLASLIKKGRDYTEEEKLTLLEEQYKIIERIVPAHLELMQKGIAEISATPYYHPILPLLCDTDSAKQSSSEISLPEKRFSYPLDAHEQVRRAKEIYQERFGSELTGMWPAEGSISDEALNVLIQENIRWAASDEGVLHNSLSKEGSSDDTTYQELEKYFPRKYSHQSKEIVLFFRDHSLSDKIGFDYHSWDARDAANDFVNHCKEIRNAILENHTEQALQNACISVILDGENCWENYYQNGKYFLDEFYNAIVASPEIEPVTFSAAIREIPKENIRSLSHIAAGSWINSNFKIWIGHPEKNHAWSLLAEARQALSEYSNDTLETAEHAEAALTSILKAEGSDWFWWYGDDNASAQKNIFDNVFRAHLVEMYIHLRLPVPGELLEPIGNYIFTEQGGAMHRAV